MFTFGISVTAGYLQITAPGLSSARVFSPGQTAWRPFNSGAYTRIISSKPITIAQFGRSLMENDTLHTDPAMLLLPRMYYYDNFLL